MPKEICLVISRGQQVIGHGTSLYELTNTAGQSTAHGDLKDARSPRRPQGSCDTRGDAALYRVLSEADVSLAPNSSPPSRQSRALVRR
jgi:hypothetical protein